MADNQDIAFNLSIGTEGGAKSLADLKKEFKSLQTELSNTKTGTAEYQRTLEKLGAVKDDIGDLRDTINALNPEGKVAAFAKVGSTIASGFAAAQGAAALFGAESEELQKTMLKVQAAMALAEGIKGIAGAADAFKVLNTVMRANPIFLIVTAITAIGAALYALKDKIGFIGDAFEAIGDVVGWITDKVTEFTDAIRLSNSELSKQGDLLTESINKSTDALAKQTQQYDDQIAVAKASGKSTIDLEIAKQKAIIETNKALVEQTIAYVRQGGELDKERAKLLTEQLEGIKKANVAIQVIEAEAKKKSLEDHKQYLKDKESEDKKHNDEFARQLDLTVQSKIENEAREKQAIEDRKNAELKAIEEIMAAENEAGVENLAREDQKVEKIKWTKEQERAAINETLNVAKMSSQQQADLANFLFDLKRKNGVKGSAEDLRLAKRQFQLNKALAIQTSIISGIQGVINALSAQSVIPEPYGTILKVANAVGVGIAATINTAKIASQQFNEGGGGGAVSGDVNLGGGATASAPAIAQPNNTVTKISDEGKVIDKPMNQRVFVLETDIAESNKKVAGIEETAKI